MALQNALTQLESDDHEINDSSSYLTLMNDLIIERIFDFLPLKDFKQCRCVCYKWKRVSEAAFKKKVRICFDFRRSDEPNDRKSSFSKYPPPEDIQEFFENSQEVCSFSALRFKHCVPWPSSSLTNLFATDGKFITDLTFDNVSLKRDMKQNSLQYFDLVNLISGIVNLKNLKILRSSTNLKNTTRFQLSLENLLNIPFIHLDHCSIELTEKVMLAPVELRLQDTIFIQNNQRVEQLLLNSYVNFTAVKILSLSCEPPESTSLKLGLLGRVALKSMTLSYVEILIFDVSSWTTDSLSLFHNIPFTQNNNLTFKHFKIFFSHCKLGCLSRSVEKLNIGYDVSILDDDPWSLFLPNLQCLLISNKTCIESIFPHLERFNNLVELTLEHPPLMLANTNVVIDPNMIPQSVKQISFIFNRFEFVSREVLKVDTLILKFADLEFVDKATTAIVPNNLFVHCVNKLQNDVHSLLQKLFDKSIPRITIGYFSWNSISHFKKSLLFPIVDRCCDFYCFVNGKGKAVSRKAVNDIFWKDGMPSVIGGQLL